VQHSAHLILFTFHALPLIFLHACGWTDEVAEMEKICQNGPSLRSPIITMCFKLILLFCGICLLFLSQVTPPPCSRLSATTLPRNTVVALFFYGGFAIVARNFKKLLHYFPLFFIKSGVLLQKGRNKQKINLLKRELFRISDLLVPVKVCNNSLLLDLRESIRW